MAELRIRGVDEDVVAMLKAQARRHGRTLGDEVREVLAEEVRRPRRQFAERLQTLRASIEAEHGILSDSTDIIREMRDSRG